MFDIVSLDMPPILSKLNDLNGEEMHKEAKWCCLNEAKLCSCLNSLKTM